MDFKTCNHHGATFPACSYTNDFIDFAINCSGRALDIGACYGVNTIPILRAGGHVTANDLEPQHLNRLLETTPEDCRDQLTLFPGRFPDVFGELPDGGYHAILAAHVLHFLDLPELFDGLRTLRRLLEPGGRIFALCFSPFTHRTRHFIPIYEQRKQLGDAFPGFIRDGRQFGLNDPSLPAIPPLIHYMDRDTVARLFTDSGFHIIRSGYEPFPDLDSAIHALYHLDNREWVGLEAENPR